MKLWKFSIDRKGWYFNGYQLVAPWWIVVGIVMMPIYYLTLSLYCLASAAYYREWYWAKETWSAR